MSPEELTLGVASSVAAVLAARGAPCAVIGAVAMAVHRYPRATADLDLATLLESHAVLEAVADEVRAFGHRVEVALSDPSDPIASPEGPT